MPAGRLAPLAADGAAVPPAAGQAAAGRHAGPHGGRLTHGSRQSAVVVAQRVGRPRAGEGRAARVPAHRHAAGAPFADLRQTDGLEAFGVDTVARTAFRHFKTYILILFPTLIWDNCFQILSLSAKRIHYELLF